MEEEAKIEKSPHSDSDEGGDQTQSTGQQSGEIDGKKESALLHNIKTKGTNAVSRINV